MSWLLEMFVRGEVPGFDVTKRSTFLCLNIILSQENTYWSISLDKVQGVQKNVHGDRQ